MPRLHRSRRVKDDLGPNLEDLSKRRNNSSACSYVGVEVDGPLAATEVNVGVTIDADIVFGSFTDADGSESIGACTGAVDAVAVGSFASSASLDVTSASALVAPPPTPPLLDSDPGPQSTLPLLVLDFGCDACSIVVLVVSDRSITFCESI